MDGPRDGRTMWYRPRRVRVHVEQNDRIHSVAEHHKANFQELIDAPGKSLWHRFHDVPEGVAFTGRCTFEEDVPETRAMYIPVGTWVADMERDSDDYNAYIQHSTYAQHEADGGYGHRWTVHLEDAPFERCQWIIRGPGATCAEYRGGAAGIDAMRAAEWMSRHGRWPDGWEGHVRTG